MRTLTARPSKCHHSCYCKNQNIKIVNYHIHIHAFVAIMLFSQILSRDSVTVSVDAVVYYRVSQYTHFNNNECILLIHRDFCFLRLNFGSTGIYVCLLFMPTVCIEDSKV